MPCGSAAFARPAEQADVLRTQARLQKLVGSKSCWRAGPLGRSFHVAASAASVPRRQSLGRLRRLRCATSRGASDVECCLSQAAVRSFTRDEIDRYPIPPFRRHFESKTLRDQHRRGTQCRNHVVLLGCDRPANFRCGAEKEGVNVLGGQAEGKLGDTDAPPSAAIYCSTRAGTGRTGGERGNGGLHW